MEKNQVLNRPQPDVDDGFSGQELGREPARINRTADLRRRLALLGGETQKRHEAFLLGAPQLDEAIGGLARGAVHELHALNGSHAVAASGFAAALAIRASGNRPIVWARQESLDAEMGALYAPGLCELGLDPGRLLLVRTRDAAGILRAGFEALSCAALGAVLIEFWGTPKALDLTAGRKLLLAAQRTGVTLFLVHVSGERRPSPAETRWAVEPGPSAALEANAPGHPAFAVTLLRHRAGYPVRNWLLEWNRDASSFEERRSVERPFLANHGPAERIAGVVAPLSRPLPSVPAHRPAAAKREARERRIAG